MAILENEIIFGIVLYKEDLDNSITFNSLVNSINAYQALRDFKVTIIIFDNTPRENLVDESKYFEYNDRINVVYYSHNENKGLPLSYNSLGKIAKERGKTWLVLLDQDTKLAADFFNCYLSINPSLKIHCPLILNNDNLLSPSKYIDFRSFLLPSPTTSEIELKNVSCINSGLMIHVDFFVEIGGYNEELFLDFCDHDFVLKVQQHNVKKLGIINCRLEQEFSAYVNTKEQALFRYRLFLKDMIAFRKNKSKTKFFFRVDLPRLLKLTYQYKSLDFLKTRFIWV